MTNLNVVDSSNEEPNFVADCISALLRISKSAQRKGPIKCEQVFVPYLAIQPVLEFMNRGNRKPNMGHIRTLALAMDEDRWYNYAPIYIDTNGKFIDGQHRLMAQKLAGIDLTYTIVSGVASATALIMDQTVSKRTMKANFAFYGYKDGGGVLDRVTKVGYTFEAKPFYSDTVEKLATPNHELVSYFVANEELLRKTHAYASEDSILIKKSTLVKAAIASAYYLLSKNTNDEVKVASFIGKIVRAEEHDITGILNRASVQLKSADCPPPGTGYVLNHKVELLLMAWNAIQKGDKVDSDFVTTGTFPTIEN